MNSRQLWFVGPQEVEVRDQTLPEPDAGQVLFRTLYSAISSGTEMLAYRGQLPQSMALDENLAGLEAENSDYPLQYGYACVGRVEDIGSDVVGSWRGRSAFAFLPHASHHLCEPRQLIPIPKGLDLKAGLFLANMETAVGLVQDAAPRLGERALVLGQGVVGQLVTSLLAQFPLSSLYAVDSFEQRRALADDAGATGSFDPYDEDDREALQAALAPDRAKGGADLIFELSGHPSALNTAIELCAYSGRIVVGSWYGSKRAEINLGERFHRKRISLLSSQVSTIDPGLTGRWDKARRFAVAWDMIRACNPEQLISHCLAIEEAEEAYRLLDESPEEALQVIFEYPD